MKNRYGITAYEFEREIQAFCPLGQDYYTCNIKVNLNPGDELFDFCKVDGFIQSLSGSNVIIEELVEKVYAHLGKYSPKVLEVRGIAKSNTHFNVTVVKSSKGV